MRSRFWMIWFVILAPVTVPGYVLFLALSNLLGGAYYIVIEATLAPLLGKPISLSRRQMALFAVPVIIAAAPAAGLHLVYAFGRGTVRFMNSIGRWQANAQSKSTAIIVGTIWTLAALWTTIACLNAAAGLRFIGAGISDENEQQLVDFFTRYRTVGDMPDEMQARRRTLIESMDPESVWREALEHDDFPFDRLNVVLQRQIADVPWFYVPAELSDDGLAHSNILFGPLIFVWMLLIRWPGTFVIARNGLATVWFAIRIVTVTLATFLLLTWVPESAHQGFRDHTWLLEALSPAFWLASVYPGESWARPEWVLFNAGLWLILAAIVVFIWWLAWRIRPFLGWPRYYVSFLAARLLQRKRIAFFSVGAVTLCVAMMVIVISVMGGFVDSIRDRAHGLLGDLVIDGSLQGFPYYDEFIDELKKLEDPDTGEKMVVEATPIIHTFGLVQFPTFQRTSAVTIRGIRLEQYARVNEFGEDLYYHERFGTTQLSEPVRQPVFGVNPKTGLPVLPGDMDAHYAKYVASLPPEEQESEKRRYKGEPGLYMGPGWIEPNLSENPDAQADKGPPKADFIGDPYPGVIFGRDLVLDRMASGEYDRSPARGRCWLGYTCRITMVPLSRAGEPMLEAPPSPAFRYIDDSRTGIHEIDSKTVYVDFNTLQRILSMGPQERVEGGMSSPRCSQIQIKLKEKFGNTAAALAASKRQVRDLWEALKPTLPADRFEEHMLKNTYINTWEEMQASYIAAIEKEKVLVLIMFGVISIVSVFLILCIFYMIVQEKTRDVGIIKSVGGSTEGIAAVFLVYGGAIGVVGCILGSMLGATFVTHINEIQDILARIHPGMRVWSPETYSFDQIPSEWKASDVIWISVLAVMASVLGATFPALRAGRTWPVESLRYE